MEPPGGIEPPTYSRICGGLRRPQWSVEVLGDNGLREAQSGAVRPNLARFADVCIRKVETNEKSRVLLSWLENIAHYGLTGAPGVPR